ncbi:MAG: rhomboid family intramembrane serine protease [Salinirussus sp.]
MSIRTPGRSPVLETLAAFGAVFLLQTLLGLAGAGGLLALGPGVLSRPWTVLTTVYAHANPAHLVGNAVIFAVVAPFLTRRTSRPRFHAFFVLAGAVAALAELAVGTALGRPPLVVGASGAILALAGYLLTGNVVTDRLLGRLSLPPRVQVAGLALLAVLVALATGGPGVAIVAHGTGILVGLAAGRLRVLEG